MTIGALASATVFDTVTEIWLLAWLFAASYAIALIV